MLYPPDKQCIGLLVKAPQYDRYNSFVRVPFLKVTSKLYKTGIPDE
jgi:hypothetical protein